MKNNYEYYPAEFVMRSKDPYTLRIIDIWKFKSTKSHKWYIIEMEHFSNNLVAVKFYYKGVRLSKLRYQFLTNDFEPRRIVYSCFELMNRYYKEDNRISFGFVASSDIEKDKNQYGNRRFRFYKALARYYFGSETFLHLNDKDERLYLLLNMARLRNKDLSLTDIINEINRTYEIDFQLSWD